MDGFVCGGYRAAKRKRTPKPEINDDVQCNSINVVNCGVDTEVGRIVERVDGFAADVTVNRSDSLAADSVALKRMDGFADVTGERSDGSLVCRICWWRRRRSINKGIGTKFTWLLLFVAGGIGDGWGTRCGAAGC